MIALAPLVLLCQPLASAAQQNDPPRLTQRGGNSSNPQALSQPTRRPPPDRPASPFANSEQLLEWINRYRLEGDDKVSQVPAAVRAMSQFGLFKENDTAGLYVGFIAGVLGDNQIIAEELITQMFPLSPAEQVVVVKAIAYSGLPDWKELLGKFVERMPARKVLIEKYLFGKAPSLNEVPLDSGPSALDTLWGIYFATGQYQPILRIMSALPWTAEKTDLNKLTVGNMAKWMLAANAANEKDVLDLCRLEVQHQPKEVAAPLREVIAAAESYEVPKIRKQALDAIDDLKRRGPAAQASMWGTTAQVAPVAIAVACVAASALGHVEFGIPCVVGGAVSQGAAKLLSGGK